MRRRTSRRNQPRRSIKSIRRRNNNKINRTTRQRRNRQGTSASGQSTFGSLVTYGVRKLVSILPGNAILEPLADVILKSVGLTGSDFSSATSADNVTTDVTSSMTVFSFGLYNILGASPIPIKHYSQTNLNYLTQFRTARAITIKIMYKPSSAMENRDGIISMGFQPYYDASEAAIWKEIVNLGWPDSRSMSSMTVSTTGPANKPLTISFSPASKHGMAYQPQSLANQDFGAVVVRFDNYNRDAYTTITASEFNPEISLSGSIELLNPFPVTRGVTGDGQVITDQVNDLLEKASIQLIDKNGVTRSVSSDLKYKITNATTNVTVTGTFLNTSDSFVTVGLEEYMSP